MRSVILRASGTHFMSEHHLLLGELVDFLSGLIIDDTHDERYRQAIAKHLVLKKKYRKDDLEAGVGVSAGYGGRQGIVNVDFLVRVEGRVLMVVKYGPGSIVTRRRSAIALSRLVQGCHVPVVVVTNGRDAEVLDGKNGKVVGRGLDAIPDRFKLLSVSGSLGSDGIDSDAMEREARIAYVFELDGSCSCDRSC